MNWWLGFLDAWNVLEEEEFFICHIHNYTEYNQQWNLCSAFNPSKCTHTWSSGQPTLGRPGSSWGFGTLLEGLTSVVDNSCRSRDSNPQPRVTSPTLYPLEPRLPRLRLYQIVYTRLLYQIVSHSIVSNKSSKILTTLFLLKKNILCYGQRNIRGQVFVVPLTGSDTVVAVFNSENRD